MNNYVNIHLTVGGLRGRANVGDNPVIYDELLHIMRSQINKEINICMSTVTSVGCALHSVPQRKTTHDQCVGKLENLNTQ